MVVSDHPVANRVSAAHRPILIASLLLTFQQVTDHSLGIHNIVVNFGNDALDLVANIGSESMHIY